MSKTILSEIRSYQKQNKMSRTAFAKMASRSLPCSQKTLLQKLYPSGINRLTAKETSVINAILSNSKKVSSARSTEKTKVGITPDVQKNITFTVLSLIMGCDIMDTDEKIEAMKEYLIK